MRADSYPSIHSRYHSYASGPAVLGTSGTMFLNKMPGIPCFSGSEQEKTLSDLNSSYILSQMSEETFWNNW